MSFREMRCTSFTESSQSSHTLHPSPGAGSTICSTVSSHKLTAPEHPAAPQKSVGHLGMTINLDLLCTLVHLHTVLKLHYHYVREMKQILYCCCEQFTIPSSYSVFFLCPLYTCLHRGPEVTKWIAFLKVLFSRKLLQVFRTTLKTVEEKHRVYLVPKTSMPTDRFTRWDAPEIGIGYDICPSILSDDVLPPSDMFCVCIQNNACSSQNVL